MKKVQVRDVPETTHARLRQRAIAEGRSLQEYLLALLNEHVATPTPAEVMRRIEQRSGSAADVGDVLDALDEERAHRR